MTPPKVDKVDIRPLDTLYFENLLGVEPKAVAPMLKGSDLVLDSKTGELKRLLAGGQTESRSLEEEAAWVKLIRESDSNGDHQIDLAEAKTILAANLAPDQVSTVSPQEFLNSIAELMKNRYGPISANLKTEQSRAAFGPTLDALRLYNRGIHVDEISLAHRTISFNAIGKTATNTVLFLPSLVYNIKGDSPLLMGDALAENAAEKKFWQRSAAIEALEDVIDAGLRKNESWALEGDLDQAMQRLDAGTRDLLNAELCATRLHRILTLPDSKERYSQLLAFAEGERPGFLGYGGGNSHMDGGWWESFWNLSGRRNNLFFAKTIFRFLAAKAATGDAAFDQGLDQQSRAAFSDMLGDGGGYGNIAAVGLTNVLCLGGLACEPTEYRDWSDEARMDGLGRGIDGALMVWGARRAFNIFGEAKRLSSYKGIREVFRIWRREGSLFSPATEGAPRFRPFPVTAWAEEANKAAKEAELLAEGKELGGKPGRFGKVLNAAKAPFSAFYRWATKGLPSLTPGQVAAVKAMGRTAGSGLGRLTKGVLILGIVQYNDQKMSPAFNSFEYGLSDLDREADFDPYPDLTKPDPSLYPGKAK
ncbi:MAG: hypothetical protein U1F66_05055 [bacterium]